MVRHGDQSAGSHGGRHDHRIALVLTRVVGDHSSRRAPSHHMSGLGGVDQAGHALEQRVTGGFGIEIGIDRHPHGRRDDRLTVGDAVGEAVVAGESVGWRVGERIVARVEQGAVFGLRRADDRKRISIRIGVVVEQVVRAHTGASGHQERVVDCHGCRRDDGVRAGE